MITILLYTSASENLSPVQETLSQKDWSPVQECLSQAGQDLSKNCTSLKKALTAVPLCVRMTRQDLVSWRRYINTTNSSITLLKQSLNKENKSESELKGIEQMLNCSSQILKKLSNTIENLEKQFPDFVLIPVLKEIWENMKKVNKLAGKICNKAQCPVACLGKRSCPTPDKCPAIQFNISTKPHKALRHEQQSPDQVPTTPSRIRRMSMAAFILDSDCPENNINILFNKSNNDSL